MKHSLCTAGGKYSLGKSERRGSYFETPNSASAPDQTRFDSPQAPDGLPSAPFREGWVPTKCLFSRYECCLAIVSRAFRPKLSSQFKCLVENQEM